MIFLRPMFLPKKQTNEIDFTTMKPQVDFFCSFFEGNLRHQKGISKLTDLYLHTCHSKKFSHNFCCLEEMSVINMSKEQQQPSPFFACIQDN